MTVYGKPMKEMLSDIVTGGPFDTINPIIRVVNYPFLFKDNAQTDKSLDDLAHFYTELEQKVIDGQVFVIAKATASNRSSMGQDVDHKRLTEIDAINGAIVSLAQKKEIPVPVDQTLTALVQTLQKNYK